MMGREVLQKGYEWCGGAQEKLGFDLKGCDDGAVEVIGKRDLWLKMMRSLRKIRVIMIAFQFQGHFWNIVQLLKLV